jgi:glycosyltransferase involved in cell wall biosynthesis
MHGHYSVSRYSSIMARGRRVIAVSDHIRRYTLDNYTTTDPADVVTVHGGASRELFPWGHTAPADWRVAVEHEFPDLAGRRWLCMPGRVTRWKGHVAFIKLVARLEREMPDLRGVCVGGCRPGSRYQDELEALAQRSGVGAHITFTGNRLDIRDWMAASEMVFNLSNDPPEAFGRTVLEALCLGRPVVGWNQGGVAEILAAMFPQGAVPVLDERELLQRARQFLAQPPTVARSNAFDLEDSMQRTVQVYHEALGGNPR